MRIIVKYIRNTYLTTCEPFDGDGFSLLCPFLPEISAIVLNIRNTINNKVVLAMDGSIGESQMFFR